MEVGGSFGNMHLTSAFFGPAFAVSTIFGDLDGWHLCFVIDVLWKSSQGNRALKFDERV